jgi:hypothetical protein
MDELEEQLVRLAAKINRGEKVTKIDNQLPFEIAPDKPWKWGVAPTDQQIKPEGKEGFIQLPKLKKKGEPQEDYRICPRCEYEFEEHECPRCTMTGRHSFYRHFVGDLGGYS